MAWFRDRDEAARALIALLPAEIGADWVVLALPRGGVPIGLAIARHLHAELGLIVVRKVGAPGNPELALAAVTGPGADRMVVHQGVRAIYGLTDADIGRLAAGPVAEVARRNALWPDVTRRPLTGRDVLIVDDGCATGTTLLAAVNEAGLRGARRIGVALPVALGMALDQLPQGVGPVICPHPAALLRGVSAAYGYFPQLADADVTAMLREVYPDRPDA